MAAIRTNAPRIRPRHCQIHPVVSLWLNGADGRDSDIHEKIDSAKTMKLDITENCARCICARDVEIIYFSCSRYIHRSHLTLEKGSRRDRPWKANRNEVIERGRCRKYTHDNRCVEDAGPYDRVPYRLFFSKAHTWPRVTRRTLHLNTEICRADKESVRHTGFTFTERGEWRRGKDPIQIQNYNSTHIPACAALLYATRDTSRMDYSRHVCRACHF